MRSLALALAVFLAIASPVQAQNIRLFEETSEVGRVRELKIIGASSTATASGQVGTITFTDDDVPESGDFGAAGDLEADGTISANAVALTTDTTGNYAAGDAEAGAALTGDTATAFFSTGTVEHERGGLEADVSAFSGLLAVSGGSTSEVDAKSELESQIADVANFAEADGDVFTGVHDFGGADSFELPQSATPTTNATGEIALDTTITDHQPFFQYFDGGENMTLIAIDTSQLPALDNEILKYDAATDKFVLEADAGGAETNSLEVITTGIASTEIPIGTAADTVVYAALSGDATMTNAGVVTVIDDLHDHVFSNIDATTSANWIGRVSDETGTGLWVFATAPTFITSITMGSATLSEAELEILDGLTATTAEIETLTDASNADSLHVHASAGLSGIVNVDLSGSAGITGANILDDTIDSADYAANSIDDEHLATTESWPLYIQSAKLTGDRVTDADATQGAGLDAGEGEWRLLFDATTDEGAVWQMRLPDYWASHSQFNIGYTMSSATANEVEYEIAIDCKSDGDTESTVDFAAIAVGSATVPATAGFKDTISITPTDDSCAAGDTMYVYLSTDANDATNDDATGDREVMTFEYEFNR